MGGREPGGLGQLAAQTERAFEVLVADDGSRDEINGSRYDRSRCRVFHAS